MTTCPEPKPRWRCPRWRYNPTALDVTTPVYPQAHAYDAVCEGADWVRNHEAPYVDVASVQVSSES